MHGISLQDRAGDALDWQALVLAQEFRERVVLTLVGFALCTVYVAPGLIAPFAFIYILGELIWRSATDDPDRRHHPLNYRLAVLGVILAEVGYAATAGLVWQHDGDFARAFAVGMIMVAIMHLVSIRSIHLPTGLIGLSAVIVIVFAMNGYYWYSQGNWAGFLLSTAAAFGALAYALTAMLSNHRLHATMREEQARARQADAAKSRFLAVLSHELRTPLNAIIGMTHAELEASGTADRQERLEILLGSARDLAFILDDATDLSAIADGRFQMRARAVDVVEEIEATIAPFRLSYARGGAQILFNVAPDLQRILKIDPQRLRQCLVNLLSNAFKHASGGPVTVSVWTGDGFLSILVSDCGPGIRHEDRERIFEPFQRGNTPAGGSGLGLTVSRSLARQMGGDLVLHDASHGASFLLKLAAEPADVAQAVPDAEVKMPDLRGRVILVVDDVATNRLVVSTYLQSSGARVREADSGEAALEILSREKVDLVLLDINMPGMDGVDTLLRIRLLEARTSGVPVVAMTADATPGMADRAASLRMDGLLIKPLSPDRLAAELSRHLPA